VIVGTRDPRAPTGTTSAASGTGDGARVEGEPLARAPAARAAAARSGGGYAGRAPLCSPRALVALAAGSLVLAGASLVLPVAPAYDPWSWLLWGREVTRLELSTAEGPAFKPLPIGLTALLAPLGGAAPALWLLVARLGALAALAAGFLVARRLAGGGAAGALAGIAACAGMAMTEGFLLHAAAGAVEPLFVALVLAALASAVADRHGPALVVGGLAALVRPESWPFLAAYAAWRTWRDRRLLPAVLLAALALPALWLVPEWLASGEPLRSGERALAPNPGAPALAAHPALESLSRAAGLLFVPTALAALAARGRLALLPAAAAAAWLVLVALLAEAGFSGEVRYSLPGAAVLAVSGGVGVAHLVRLAARRIQRRLARAAAVAVAAIAVTPFAVVAVAQIAERAPRLAHEAALADALPQAIDAAGGRERLLACGRPAVGRFRGPLLAYHLDVEKRRVRADGRPAEVSFRSRVRSTSAFEPEGATGARPRVAGERWRIETACRKPTTTVRR